MGKICPECDSYVPDDAPSAPEDKCEVQGCANEAMYEGWYSCRDPLLGTPSGLMQRRRVCEEHTVLLRGGNKEPSLEDKKV